MSRISTAGSRKNRRRSGDSVQLIARHDHGLRLVVDGERYSAPFDAVVARLVGSDDLQLYQVRLDTTLRAVAAVCGDTAQPAAASRIVDRLRELGVPVRRDTILRQIRQSGQAADDNDAVPDPTAAAEAFLADWEQVSAEAGNANNHRVLHFFAGEFYRWQQPWKPMSSKEFQAVVTNYLQEHDTRGGITQRFVNDVVTNLAGRAVVACDSEPLPFMIEDYGPPATIQRPQLLVFENGMLDVDALVRGEDTELLPFDSRWFSTVKLPYAFNSEARCPRFLAIPVPGIGNRPGNWRPAAPVIVVFGCSRNGSATTC